MRGVPQDVFEYHAVMFTGLIHGKGRILSIARTAKGWRLRIQAGRLARGVRAGESLAVDGCCLTALGRGRTGRLVFDVVPETWRRTTLRHRAPGDRVNLERPLRWGQRLDGHLVQGHVDGVGEVQRLTRGRETRLRVSLARALSRYAIPKGSIALDGVSLTLAAVRPGAVEVALIPKTLRLTTLGLRRPGDRVNVEMDLLARLAARRARPSPRRSRGRLSGAPRAGRS